MVGVLCAAVLLSALATTGTAVFLAANTPWILIGFEAVVIVASIIGILFALGRVPEGQGLALLCVAGTFPFAAFCTWLSLAPTHELVLNPDKPGVSLSTWAVARGGAGALLALIAAYAVLRRQPMVSIGYLIRAALAIAPVILIGGLIKLAPAVVQKVTDVLPDWLAAVIAVIAGLVALVLISVSAHCVIRSFEAGRTDELGNGQASQAKA
jgi:hypothetical protein